MQTKGIFYQVDSYSCKHEVINVMKGKQLVLRYIAILMLSLTPIINVDFK